MKKMIMFSALALSMACFAGAAQAVEVGSNTAGEGFTISTAGKGPGFDVSVSPGVLARVDSVKQVFVIQTMNTVANANNRIEYGVYSGYPGYYQQANDTDTFKDEVEVTDETTDSPFADGWEAMGGTAPAGS